MKGVNGLIDSDVETRKLNEEALFHANHNNAAHQVAVVAYNASPSDMEGYKRTYRELMGKIRVPFSQQARAVATSAAVKSQYFWPIMDYANT
jgi:hypothetical protein